MSSLVPFNKSDIQIPGDYHAAGLVVATPGSGVHHEGGAVLVLRPTMLELRSKNGVIEAVYYESIIRANECEFRGLVIERYTDDGFMVLSAPNETFGVEVVYKAGATYERRLKFLTFSARNAREWVDVINDAVAHFYNHGTSGNRPVIRGK